MSGDPVFLILKSTSWLPADEWETLLGAVVKNFWSPTNNSTPPNPLQYNAGQKFVEKKFNNFVLTINDGAGSAAEVKLKNIGGIKWAGHTDEDFDLSGKHIYYTKLRQHEDFWKKLKEDEDFKTKVPAWLGSRWKLKSKIPVCLITGIFFCQDVVIATTEEEERDLEMDAGAPLGSVLASAAASHGISLPSDGTGNVEVRASSDKHHRKYFKAEDKDASIFALELKTLKSSLFNEDIRLMDETPKAPKNRQLGGRDSEIPSPDSLEIESIDPAEWENWEEEYMSGQE
jgi:hypothetical protein